MTGSDETRLLQFMRAAIGPVEESTPRRDLWPDVVRRIHERPRLSFADKTLIGALLVLVPLFPRSFLFLMYSL